MFFPEGSGTPFTLRVPRYLIHMTVVSIVVVLAGLGVLIYKIGDISLKMQLVHDLNEENNRLREHSRDLEISSEKITNIDSMTAYLRRLASVAELKTGAAAPQPAAAAAPAVTGAAQPPPQPDRAAGAGAAAARRGAQPVTEFAASIPNIMPVDGWVTRSFLNDPASPHLGLDVAAASGTPIRVTAMGAVEDVRNDKYYGLTVEIRHENGFVTRYSHCSQVLVQPGDRVNRGQTIALVGNTGRSTAPHLHYEVMKSGKYADPMSFIGAHKQQ